MPRLYRFSRFVGVLVLLAACAERDDRPLTVQYVTETVLAPSCGNAQCHSSFKNEDEYSLDTVAAVRTELTTGLLGPIFAFDGVDGAGKPIIRGTNVEDTTFIQVLLRTEDRMPYDQPLSERDIHYLMDYLEAGAPGAQCKPGSGTCVDNTLLGCDANYNFTFVQNGCP